MFAVAALLAFLLSMFHAPVDIDLMILGLVFLAAHEVHKLVGGGFWPGVPRRP